MGKKIVLIGCGTAYHSCLIAKYLFQELTSITVETDIASEFRYRKIQFRKNDLYILEVLNKEISLIIISGQTHIFLHLRVPYQYL